MDVLGIKFKKHKRFTQEMTITLRQLHSNDVSAAEIARQLEAPLSSVHAYLKDLGLKPLSSSDSHKGILHTDEWKKKMSERLKGKPRPAEWGVNISKAKKGKKQSQEHIDKLTQIRRKCTARGEASHAWKGGKTPKNREERACWRVAEWRKNVFVKHNYTCQECGRHGGTLHAHHVNSWSEFPELRFDIDNGQTLCIKCHQKTFIHGQIRQQ